MYRMPAALVQAPGSGVVRKAMCRDCAPPLYDSIFAPGMWASFRVRFPGREAGRLAARRPGNLLSGGNA